MTPLPSPLADVVTEALAARPALSPGAWALVLGTADRRVARPFAGARVVMNEGVSGLSLPRESFDVALWLAVPGVAIVVDALVVVRNALGREAPLHVIAARSATGALLELADVAGFSRRTAHRLPHGLGALDLRR
jgi:hypothetical protein